MSTTCHIRRCHMCDQVTIQTEDPVSQCHHCGKFFSPFFYFDEKLNPVLTDFTLRPPPLPGQYAPIQGLSALWDFPDLG